MINDFFFVIKEIREKATDPSDQGTRFEELMVQYFRTDPFYKNHFKWVKLWTDWEDNSGQDIGIDLVAEEAETGGICAIQCKFYDEDYKIQKKDLEPLIAASSKKPYTSRIFIHTAGAFTTNATKLLIGQEPQVTVLDTESLAGSRIEWPELHENPTKLKYIGDKFEPRDDQKQAINAVVKAFKGTHPGNNEIQKGTVYDRGKMVMACGTGKTFTSLKIAEKMAGKGGRVLYLVPSISLLQQTMREWAEQHGVLHRYVGICSDAKAGKNEENENMFELEIPVTTNPRKISHTLQQERPDAMLVVFSTYQSIELINQAQKVGAPEFDIVFVDEAHRTTGLEKLEKTEDDKVSAFVRIHDVDYIKAKKRLYMTATPRVYAPELKRKAGEKDYGIYSMDEVDTYGPTFYELNFSEAVTHGILADYKVIIVTVDEEFAARVLADQDVIVVKEGVGLGIMDVAKIVGSAKALSYPETDGDGKPIPDQKPLRRSIAFCNTIKYSQAVEAGFQQVVEALKNQDHPSGEISVEDLMDFQIHHVDGKTNAFDRRRRIDWLKEKEEARCRILSNARCLTEGIDVPALDSAIFMSQKNSYVDIIQAVGRVMRKSPGKKYGYIVLPVVIPTENLEDPNKILDKNKDYEVVWRVLQALRSHDERLDIAINAANFDYGSSGSDNKGGDTNAGPEIIVRAVDSNGVDAEAGSAYAQLQLELKIGDKDWLNAIHTRIVEKVGDRRYWEHWATDVADIASRSVKRIKALLKNEKTAQEFAKFLSDLHEVVSPALTDEDAVNMMAQHLITAPVFEALFEGYDFANSNPVSIAMTKMVDILGENDLDVEIKDLEGFYKSVKNRARAISDPEKRQDLIRELYERFFQTAFEKDSKRLGIVYTPVELVDFILHSAEDVLQKEFGKSLSDEGVNIIDPFTGTGTFIARLLQSDLIKDADLERKFKKELHANEIVLLAYYIAAINIEEAYHGRRQDKDYESFDGIVLRDTFLSGYEENSKSFDRKFFPINHKRARLQDESDIEVMVGNPPWSAWQKSASDYNPNTKHEELDGRISDTYAVRSTAQQKASLYDSYIKAIRWASDRIGDEGVIAFVTNGGWLDGLAADGMRACLAEEFSSIYCFNLRGNTRLQGDAVDREGGKIFGQGSRATVIITLLVKSKTATTKSKIFYKDIGDYLSQQEKLRIISNFCSINGIEDEDWKLLIPDENNDWINQRDPKYQTYDSIGNSDAKTGKSKNAIFKIYSNGIKAGRDFWAYNSSQEELASRSKKAVIFYNKQIEENTIKNPEENLEILKWHREILQQLNRGKLAEFNNNSIRGSMYRPYFKQFLHHDKIFNHFHYQMDKIFPTLDSENLLINIAGRSSNAFSTISTKLIPDLHLEGGGGQTFPRWIYGLRKPKAESRKLYEFSDSSKRKGVQRRIFDPSYSDPPRYRDGIKGPGLPQVPIHENKRRSKRGYL